MLGAAIIGLGKLHDANHMPKDKARTQAMCFRHTGVRHQ